MLLWSKCGNKLVRRNAFGAVRITIPIHVPDMSTGAASKHSAGMIGKMVKARTRDFIP